MSLLYYTDFLLSVRIIHCTASVSAHFGLPWVRHWVNRGKCYMERKRIVKRIAAYIPIYLQPFTSYSEILVGNCNSFLPPCI